MKRDAARVGPAPAPAQASPVRLSAGRLPGGAGAFTCQRSPSIRPAAPPDLPEIAAIQAASPEAASWPAAAYLQYDLRVAVLENRVAGYLAARSVAADEFEILDLAVAPEFRRLGVGQALMGSFLASLHGTVFLEVRRSNLTAREFYKSLGFQELTVREQYYSLPPEAAIVMKFHSC
jgi:ribosomal-protein-alanine N-acetyltransferase